MIQSTCYAEIGTGNREGTKMSLKASIFKWWSALRINRMEKRAGYAQEDQLRTLRNLLDKAKYTQFGKDHGFESIQTVAQFQEKVPVRDYEAAKNYFDQTVKGVPDVLWPGVPLYFGKTSGTTSGAKYIPITRDSVKNFIHAALESLMGLGVYRKDAGFVEGKMLFLSGSPQLDENEHGMKIGRLSGISHVIVPGYAKKNRLPSLAINEISDWETKVEKVLEEAMQEDLRLISGIPSWILMFFEKLKERTGKLPVDQWPNLVAYVHGGVNFEPYETVFEEYFQGKVTCWETYPASEGFLGIQMDDSGGMRLVLNQGIFYEFIPLEEAHQENPTRFTVGEVKQNQQYAIILTTSAGLWAYHLGDVVRFTSLNPPRIKVTGRVKHFISAFGEHVIGEEVDAAMVATLEGIPAEVNEYTVAPFLATEAGESYHEWLVEFKSEPEDINVFSQQLDQEMRKQNAYYEDLRTGNILRQVKVTPLFTYAFRNYMKSIGKLGGQNKIPRLSNDRKIADALYKYRKK